jgi:filamentous hemagglutinin family protein
VFCVLTAYIGELFYCLPGFSNTLLGTQSSQVSSPTAGTVQIDGGATSGANLFHSFSQFSVPTNGVVTFNNVLDIQNIISRVTGTSISNIDGLIQANGSANLFLINPNGIVFGPNAALNIGGSFVGTTANAVQFGEQGTFNATSPIAPGLLSVNPSALLFNQIAAQQPSITVNANRPLGTDGFGNSIYGLRVPTNQSLMLVGGDININGGGLVAPGGHVELASVIGLGSVGLFAKGRYLGLDLPNTIGRGDVRLANNALINLSHTQGGSVTIFARNLSVGDSNILSNTNSEQGDSMVFNATETASFSNSLVRAATFGQGQGGDVVVIARSLQLSNGGLVGTNTFGSGRSGDLTVNATDIQLNSATASSLLFAQTAGSGNGGDLTISTGKLQVLDGSQIGTGTFATGKSGQITINASEILLKGTAANPKFPSGLFSVGSVNSDDSGDISITTGTLQLLDGAQIRASSDGAGKGGTLTVNANEVLLRDARPNPQFPTGLFTTARGSGDGGDLNITTGTLQVFDGAQVANGTFGSGNAGQLVVSANEVILKGTTLNGEVSSQLVSQSEGVGDAGDITITTATLHILDGARISATTSGSGKGGKLAIKANEVVLKGNTVDGQFSSGLSSTTSSSGDAGDISITTGTLKLLDGAVISTETLGSGNGGQLAVSANNEILLSGTTRNGQSYSGLSSATSGSGNAGNLSISTARLQVLDGARVSAETIGVGNGGKLTVNANEVLLRGASVNGQFRSGFYASAGSNATGSAGDIRVQTNQLTIQNGATISAGTSNPQGQAGNITIQAKTILLDGGSIAATTGVSPATGASVQEGANIRLEGLDLLLMQNGSLISAQATGDAKGGNIFINAANGFVVAAPNQNNDIIASATQGQGGNIDITAQGIFNFTEGQATPNNSANDIDASSEFGTAGTVVLNSPEFDPSREIVELPANFVDVAGLIAQGCVSPMETPTQAQGQLSITGHGGLPTRPTHPLRSDTTVVGLVAPVEASGTQPQQAESTPNTEPKAFAVAQGWRIDPNGDVVLTAGSNQVGIPPFASGGGCYAR